jgi:hypothetical protein
LCSTRRESVDVSGQRHLLSPVVIGMNGSDRAERRSRPGDGH